MPSSTLLECVVAFVPLYRATAATGVIALAIFFGDGGMVCVFLGECIDMWQLDENAEKGNSGGRVGVLVYNLDVAKTGAVYLCFRV